ncbi:MAG: integrase core domain-containing protein [Caldilineaceae bacterium]
MTQSPSVDQLRQTIAQLLNEGRTPSQIAKALDCSRTTIYKVRNLLQDSQADLQDGRHSNSGRPQLYEDRIWELLLTLRTSRRSMGPDMLYYTLVRNAEEYGIEAADIPSPSTIARWIHSEGLAVKPIGPKDMRAYPDKRPTRPGTFTLDTWGPWHCRAQRLYAITVMDRFTRAATLLPLASISGHTSLRATAASWPAAIQMAHLLLPPGEGMERLYVDNGIGMVPAFGTLPQGARYALKYGARLVFIPPGQPWRNGRLERWHYTLEREYFRIEFPPSVKDALTGLHAYLNWYNTERPHSALQYKAPGDVFPWIKPMAEPPWLIEQPERIGPQEGIVEAVRLVNNDGTIALWQGGDIAFTDVLAGQFVRIQFQVSGEPDIGRIVYTQRKNQELVVATFNHRLDAGGQVKGPLITDLVAVDFDPGVVPQNQNMDQSQLDSQKARIAKRKVHFREASTDREQS